MTTSLDIAEARGIIASATPGPWRVTSEWIDKHSGCDAIRGATDQLICRVDEHDGGYGGGERNIDFIAYARTAFPLALDELEAARAELEEVKDSRTTIRADRVIGYQRLVVVTAERDAARAQLAKATRERDEEDGAWERAQDDLVEDHDDAMRSVLRENAALEERIAALTAENADLADRLQQESDALTVTTARVVELTAENSDLARECDRLASRECHHPVDEYL